MVNSQVPGRRLVNQHIDDIKFEKPEEVIRWMGAMQAQSYLQALWAIGVRMQSATVTDIEMAIADGKILRTWPMRGTIHFVPPEDAKWMLNLSAPRILAKNRRRQEQLGLDEETLEDCKQLFYDTLKGGKRLSRPDMMHLLEEAGISTEGQRGYHILLYASLTILICIGPMEGKQQTFVLLDEWVPHSMELSREESLAELARRYFTSHGPATVHDFAWWTGLKVTDAKQGLVTAKAGLISEKINDKEHWMTANQIENSTSGVHLLPGFDEYLLGYKNRSAVLAAEYAPQVVPGNNGMFLPMIVVDGQIVGTWKRTIRKNSLDISFNLFTKPGVSKERLIEAAQRYSDFMGLPLSTLKGNH